MAVSLLRVLRKLVHADDTPVVGMRLDDDGDDTVVVLVIVWAVEGVV